MTYNVLYVALGTYTQPQKMKWQMTADEGCDQVRTVSPDLRQLMHSWPSFIVLVYLGLLFFAAVLD